MIEIGTAAAKGLEGVEAKRKSLLVSKAQHVAIAASIEAEIKALEFLITKGREGAELSPDLAKSYRYDAELGTAEEEG